MIASLVNALFANLNQLFRPRGHVFYGWWIVLSAGGVQWLAGVLWLSLIHI